MKTHPRTFGCTCDDCTYAYDVLNDVAHLRDAILRYAPDHKTRRDVQCATLIDMLDACMCDGALCDAFVDDTHRDTYDPRASRFINAFASHVRTSRRLRTNERGWIANVVYAYRCDDDTRARFDAILSNVTRDGLDTMHDVRELHNAR